MIISVLVINQSFILRKGLASFISEIPELKWCGEASDCNRLEQKLMRVRPDVLLVDAFYFNLGTREIQAIQKVSPNTKILSISQLVSKARFGSALQSGITSCLLNECDQEEVLEAVFSTHRGESFLCGKITEVLLSDKPVPVSGEWSDVSCAGFGITERESEIIQHIALGLSNKQIADKLFLSTHTVNTHRKNIMAKLGVNNTAGVVMFAVKNRLLEPNQFLFSN